MSKQRLEATPFRAEYLDNIPPRQPVRLADLLDDRSRTQPRTAPQRDGLRLGEFGTSWIAAVQLLGCRHENGEIDSWAQEIVARLNTYTEADQADVTAIFLLPDAHIPEVQGLLGAANGRRWVRGEEHENFGFEAIELRLDEHFVPVTQERLPDAPETLNYVGTDTLGWLAKEAAPAFGKPESEPEEPHIIEYWCEKALGEGGLPRHLAELWAGLPEEAQKSIRGEWRENDLTLSYELLLQRMLGLLYHHGWSLREVEELSCYYPKTLWQEPDLLPIIWADLEEFFTQKQAKEHTTAGEERKEGATNPPKRIDGDWWLEREIERPTPLMGDVICSTTRMLIGGPTGAGKTHLAMAWAEALSNGCGWLHWLGPPKPVPVLYIDGEMARDLVQDRMRDLHRRTGRRLGNFHMLCREDFPHMESLATPDGHAFILAKVEEIQPKVIFFDSRMCLTPGEMKEEQPWRDFLPLLLELTRRRVAIILIDHMGHQTDRIYGSKLKEWQMDVVAILEVVMNPEADISVRISFTKARRRHPGNRADFASGVITLLGDQWVWMADDPVEATEKKGRGRKQDDFTISLKRAIYFLASGPDVALQKVKPDMVAPVRAISTERLRAHLIEDGWFVEESEFCGNSRELTQKGREKLANRLTTLRNNGIIGFDRHFVWPVLG